MAKIIFAALLFLGMLPGLGWSENLSGIYSLSSQGVTLTLTLKQDPQGNIKGTLSSTTGAQFQVEGIVKDGVGLGVCKSNEGGSFFEAHPKGNQLLFALIEAGPNNKPDYSKARQLTFNRKEGTPGSQHAPQASTKQQGGQLQPAPLVPPMGGSVALFKDEVSDPNWGFKFSLPKGWKVEKGPKGAILGHDTIPGMIWVFPHSTSSLQEVQKQMRAGLDEEEVQLRLTSQLESLGNNATAGIFSGVYQRQQVKARGIGTYSPNGRGAYIVAMTLPQKFGSDLTDAADAIAKSIQYFKVQESARTGEATAPLMRQMSGVYYSFSSAGLSYSGGTERRVVLCPNGTYYSGSESSYSAGAGTSGAWGAAGQRGDRGTWRVQGNINEGVLTTFDASGKPTEYRYRRCGGDCIYIGNTKFAVSTPANCP